MTIDVKKIASIGAAIAVLGAGPALAQDMMSDWDSDGDGIVNEEEFNEGWNSQWSDGESAFDTWDGDGDGMLSEDEFNSGVFNSYDADDSGVIEEPEFGDVGDDLGDGGFWDV
ncbi:EF-hand domain-containing protein [Jannaschia formosa]|uniref:EF-hand domain-containing protein n=1 Tax=Jannaschia formosa TaxID=2259592 RepID=UPI000E1B9210|nr:EF-hand domain-containing protein [Jannaschia formosa]TFL16010.1 hypothetical protein DR046_22315 [Jannaschia formosa]